MSGSDDGSTKNKTAVSTAGVESLTKLQRTDDTIIIYLLYFCNYSLVNVFSFVFLQNIAIVHSFVRSFTYLLVNLLVINLFVLSCGFFFHFFIIFIYALCLIDTILN